MKMVEHGTKSEDFSCLQVIDTALDVHFSTGHLLPDHGAVLQQEVDGVEDVPTRI